MAISFGYNKDAAKLTVTATSTDQTGGFTLSYTIDGGSSQTLVTGNTTASFSNYFLYSGATYVFTTVSASGTGTTTIYVDYDNTFLVSSGTNKAQQISIIYNENISSFKPVRKDFIQETIGSKYPFVIRNASINYDTMEFSGMITSLMDIENFSGYRTIAPSTNYNNQNERKFREWFESWVADGTPKVFKSNAEGLKIVRLTNLNLTPIRSTGRQIYEFSCTLTEIADFSVDNLKKYKFLQGV